MSDIFRIFVTEKEIVIRIFTIKTPGRWAKRQRFMRNMKMNENTIKDLGTLNRGQSMLLNLYIKGYIHVTLAVYTFKIELTVYLHHPEDLTVAEIIIRDQMADGDTIEYQGAENYDGDFSILRWCGNLIETDEE